MGSAFGANRQPRGWKTIVRDLNFAAPMKKALDFDFGEQTTQVFDDMLVRSVPFYDEIQHMIAEIVANLVEEKPVVYDLGCSTGTTLLMLATRLKNKNPRLVGLDQSVPMLNHARKRAEQAGLTSMITWQQHDLNEPLITDPSDAFIMNLSLQFIRPLNRERLVSNLYHSLKPRGCLILVEKIIPEDSLLNRTYIELYYGFKRRNGYSDLEIAQKREALENILIPYRVNENLELLNRCGFKAPDTFFRWLNFAGFIGIKQ